MPAARFYSSKLTATRQVPFALQSAQRGLAEQAAHRRGPIGQFARALPRVHARFEAALHAPMIHKSVRLGKEASVQAGEICCAKRGRFFDLRTIDSIAKNVGEPLHSPIRSR